MQGVLLSSFLNSSSLETHSSYARSRDVLFQYLLGKTDALVPLPFLADELSSWEPHFQIVLQQKSHSLDCLFSKSAPSDLNAFSAILYSWEIFLNARSTIAVICIILKLGTYIQRWSFGQHTQLGQRKLFPCLLLWICNYFSATSLNLPSHKVGLTNCTCLTWVY